MEQHAGRVHDRSQQSLTHRYRSRAGRVRIVRGDRGTGGVDEQRVR
jgi:hypothetical protein